MKSVAFLALAASIPSFAAPCESLKSLNLPQTTISAAEDRAPGSFTAPAGGRPTASLPAFCRVTGVIKPTPDSDIRFEVWLPAPTVWNGKFQGYGNGGFAGDIGYSGLADAVAHDYATASTDTGHQSTPGAPPDAHWALDHPEKIVDFGYRAVHETAVAAKRIIAAYYGNGPQHSYFNSCSNGGRQALMEAQRFPSDYDGIIAGAPANDWTHLLAGAGRVKSLFTKPENYIPSAKLPAIQAAALAQCDAADGVKDGVIENPLACRFDPAALLCRGPETDACLTATQLASLNMIYGGIKDAGGRKIFPGLSPGGEAEPGGWSAWVTGDGPTTSRTDFSTEFFRYMVYSDPAWTAAAFDLARDSRAADEKLAKTLNSTSPDISAFTKRGGRLIIYHGWADPAIPPVNAIDYFNAIGKTLGPAATQAAVRLYMVPGMGHCGGGSGPNQFGALSVPHADPQHDLDAALEAWVEKAQPPAAIIASKVEKGKVTRTRPLCAWPAVAKWNGSGSTDDARNFSCVKP
jgi:feruloyl esterase